MRDLVLLVLGWLLTGLFVAGAVIWLLVAAWKSSFRYNEEEELSPLARRELRDRLAALARRRQQEGL